MSDDATFEVFVRAHSSALLASALLLAGSRHAAEDLVQETLTYLYPRWDRVSGADAPLAYVRRCLANRFVSSRRSAASRDLSVWELPDGWGGLDLSETVATRRTLWQSLGHLSVQQRSAVVLRYYHDLPDEQVAEMLGCRPATVRSLISRAMRSLRVDPSAVVAGGTEALS